MYRPPRPTNAGSFLHLNLQMELASAYRVQDIGQFHTQCYLLTGLDVVGNIDTIAKNSNQDDHHQPELPIELTPMRQIHTAEYYNHVQAKSVLLLATVTLFA